MSSKPSTICQLVKGKLIDTCKGFVETFNWVAGYVSNLEGEEPEDGKLTVEVADRNTDHPKLKIRGDAGMKLKSGNDSNVVISSEKDDEGYYTIDIYYK